MGKEQENKIGWKTIEAAPIRLADGRVVKTQTIVPQGVYKYALFDPRPTPEAKEHNEKIFASGPVFGIEVTKPELAARCDLGNLDPQHGRGDSEKTAIEEALEAALPPAGAVLATIRPDLDSVGAMIALTRRSQGLDPMPSLETIKRIQDIIESDKFARGPWPGKRPLPTLDDVWAGDRERPLAAIAACVSDFRRPIEERVKAMEDWLWSGREPAGYREKVEAERRQVAEALSRGDIKIKEAAGGKIAIVESAHRAATSIGYRLAPVVVAVNPEFRFQGSEPHRKITVCQFREGHLDLKEVLDKLAAKEPGWGGSPTIGGSPQGVSSSLDIEEIVKAVESVGKPRIVIKRAAKAKTPSSRVKSAKSAQMKHAELKQECQARGLNPPQANQKQGKTWKQIVCMKNQLKT
jgi:hypothetical protein